jgi:zinc protease
MIWANRIQKKNSSARVEEFEIHMIHKYFSKWLFASILLVFVETANAFEIDTKDFTLPNGMRIVLIPDPQSPAVIHSLWFRVGAADDAPGRTGLAHFLEHLMYKGTKTRRSGDYFRTVDQNGAEINAFTTRDYTVYHVRMAKEMLPRVMELEADRMSGLVIREDEMLTEREVVKEERRERYENDPAALLTEMMDAALLPGHPYGHPGIGVMDDVIGLSQQDAENFYNSYYHPNNAVAVVSGPLDLEELRALTDEYYAPLKPAAKLPKRSIAALPAKVSKSRVEIINPQARNDVFRRSYQVPSFSSADGKDAYALDFLASALASGTQGRLFEELVIKTKVAADLAAGYSGSFRHAGDFGIWAVPGSGYTVVDVEKAVDRVLADVLKNGVTQAEVNRALRRAKISSVYTLDRQMGMVELVGSGIMNGLEPDEVLDFDRWSGVTAADVTAVARKYLRADKSVTGTVLRMKAK